MSKITNTPKIQEEKIDLGRSCIEHRGTWMALIFDEMEKNGCDAEKITRAAIKKCGNFHGLGFKRQCENPEDAKDFAKVFMVENAKKMFEINVAENNEDCLKLEFHYCGLVNAWKKLGYDDEKIALFCDMAMDGDRGIAESMGMELDLTDTIAKGCPTCKVNFIKKK